MTTIGTTVKFETAHRQYKDPGKCGFLHGHNWVAEVIIEGHTDKLGYVIDFKDVKTIINEMDHKVLLSVDDPLVEELQKLEQKVMVLPDNPTCENIAKYIARKLVSFDVVHIREVTVVLWENDKSWAKYVQKVK